MSDDLRMIETFQENAERVGDLTGMLRHVRQRAVIDWAPDTREAVAARTEMLTRIDRALGEGLPPRRTMDEEIQSLTRTLIDVREQSLIHWEPNTPRDAEARTCLLENIASLVGQPRLAA